MIVFAGTSNPTLAHDMAKLLGISLGKVEITRFIDNECRVFIQEDVKGQEVYVVQSLSAIADQHLVELCLLGSALKNLGAAKITAVIPWMGYSKQDKAFRPGEAISAQLVAKFIEAAGFDAVITCELHSENVIPYFSIPVTELSTRALLVDALKKNITLDVAQTVVVSPDKGGKSRSETFAREVGLPIIYADKKRSVQTGLVSIMGMDGEVKGKTVIIFDDIINTGSTAIEVSKFAKAQGAISIYFLATHGVFAGGAPGDLQTSTIDHVYVTDTIHHAKPMFAKCTTISVASLLTGAIARADTVK
jgi:ribose-phosphate pyrophosphokinase